ncbi:MAG: hypothetical protein Q4G02_02600 [bacterium]|nr:hypothetical protein [bacterium]
MTNEKELLNLCLTANAAKQLDNFPLAGISEFFKLKKQLFFGRNQKNNHLT